VSKHELYKQLSKQPLSYVFGLVDGAGPGGVLQEDGRWILGFRFVAWRTSESSINSSKLVVRKLVGKEELSELSAQIGANSIIEIRARVALVNCYDSPQALLEEFVGASKDNGLMEFFDASTAPVYTDKDYGDFVFDSALNEFVAQTSWMSEPIELHLRTEDKTELSDLLSTARVVWSNSELWNRNIVDSIVRELLPYKNSDWKELDEPEITQEQFRSRVALSEIAVSDDDGSWVEFIFSDGSLFDGRSIVASSDLDCKEITVELL